MNDTAVKKARVGRGKLIFGAVIAAAVLFGLLYFFQYKYGFTWPKVGWSLVFAVLLFATFYTKIRGQPAVLRSYRPGVMTLESAVAGFVLLFVMTIPNSKEFIDTVLSELWPLVAGVSISWFAGSIYYVLFAHE
jgi:hypothetical protein